MKLPRLFTFGDGSFYQKSKDYKGMYKAAVSGVGDEAFSGPSQNLFGGGDWTGDPYLIVGRKGSLAFSVTSFFDYAGTGKPVLTKDQLTELAKLVASRM